MKTFTLENTRKERVTKTKTPTVSFNRKTGLVHFSVEVIKQIWKDKLPSRLVINWDNEVRPEDWYFQMIGEHMEEAFPVVAKRGNAIINAGSAAEELARVLNVPKEKKLFKLMMSPECGNFGWPIITKSYETLNAKKQKKEKAK
jgi:hypothetical protein